MTASTEVAPTVSEAIADFVAGLGYDDLPESVVVASKLHILDTIGIGIAGAADEIGRIVGRWAAGQGRGSSWAMAFDTPISATDAAFVNGASMHALDFDGGTFGGHPSPCIVPAVLAVADPQTLQGRDVVAAYAAAMEVFGRFGLATNHEVIHYNGFHPTTVFGMLATAAGAGKVIGLERPQLAHAIALAASSGAGITANFGSMAKPAHAGNVATSGVRSAQLAGAGFQAHLGVLEEEQGFQTAYMRDEIDWEAYRTGLGAPLRMSFAPPGIKRYPTCGGNQRAIENSLALVRTNGIAPEEIDSVTVDLNPHMLKILRYDWPENQYEAKFSLKFNVAAALMYGPPSIATYRTPLRDAPALRDLGRRIAVNPVGTGNRSFATVTVRLVDGRVFSVDETHLPGSPEAPLGQDAVVTKFLACCDGVVDEAFARRLSDAVLTIEDRTETFWSLWREIPARIAATSGSAGGS